ncbi:MAG: glycosyltransferase [Rhodocyclaceae bacterium]|nr:glycosyltransferase [Rhodocyclaceae bacterium]
MIAFLVGGLTRPQSPAVTADPPPRVLISYFFEDDSIPLGFACRDAFEALGFHARGFHGQAEHRFYRHVLKPASKLLKALSARPVDLSRGTRWHNAAFREAELRRAVADFRPDLLLVIRGNSFDGRVLSELKAEYGIRACVGWWVKDPRSDDQMLRDADSYDHYFCIHTHGYDAASGIHHLPALGVYSRLYRPTVARSESNFVADIVFAGGHGERRERYVRPLLDHDLRIYGPGWRKGRRIFDGRLMRRWAGSGIWGEPLVDMYCRSRIVLNVTSWDPQRLGGQNLRLLDVPATAAFLLTDDTDEVREYFTPGQEIETFTTPEELRDKVAFYLARPEARERIARAGYERSRRLPTYEMRMKALLDAIGWR